MSGMCCQIDVMRCAINVVLGQKLMPLQGDGSLCVHTPRALPWSGCSLAFQSVDGNTRHSYFNGRIKR